MRQGRLSPELKSIKSKISELNRLKSAIYAINTENNSAHKSIEKIYAADKILLDYKMKNDSSLEIQYPSFVHDSDFDIDIQTCKSWLKDLQKREKTLWKDFDLLKKEFDKKKSELRKIKYEREANRFSSKFRNMNYPRSSSASSTVMVLDDEGNPVVNKDEVKSI